MKSVILFALLFCLGNLSIAQNQNIVLTTPAGESIESQTLMQNGNAKVVVFWSSYCRYCKLEMKGISNIGKNWFEDYDAEVVFVSLENYPSNAYTKLTFLEDFQKEAGVYFVHDNNLKFYRAQQSTSIPSTILLDKNGKIIQRWNTYDDGLERSIGMYFKKLKATEPAQ